MPKTSTAKVNAKALRDAVTHIRMYSDSLTAVAANLEDNQIGWLDVPQHAALGLAMQDLQRFYSGITKSLNEYMLKTGRFELLTGESRQRAASDDDIVEKAGGVPRGKKKKS